MADPETDGRDVNEAGLLHYPSEWFHLTGSVSYSRRHVEAFYPTLPQVELVPLALLRKSREGFIS